MEATTEGVARRQLAIHRPINYRYPLSMYVIHFFPKHAETFSFHSHARERQRHQSCMARIFLFFWSEPRPGEDASRISFF